MSRFGFVYIMTNEYMPDIYKVGCTERSPHLRAAELSAPTGVPGPFKVLCYAECEDHQSGERLLHDRLEHQRAADRREFFMGPADEAVRLLYWMPGVLSFVVPSEYRADPMDTRTMVLLRESGLLSRLCESANPYQEANNSAQSHGLRVVGQGGSRHRGFD